MKTRAARPPAVELAALGVAGGAFGVALAAAGGAETLYGALRLFAGMSFVGVGIYAWWRRPANRVGLLMTATGFLWLVANVAHLTTNPLIFTASGVIGALYHATTIHLLLAFPTGHLRTRNARLTALAGYVVVFGGSLVVFLVADLRTHFDCATCPENVLQLVHNNGVADAAITVINLLGAAVVAYVFVQLVLNWRKSTGWRRRALTPLLFAGAASAFLLGLTFLVLAFDEHVAEDVFIAAVAAFGLVPYAFLLGLARSAMLGGGAVGELFASLPAPHLPEATDALRRALGDPSLELAFLGADGQRYVTPDGRRIELPAAGDARGYTLVDLDARAVAAIVYDAALVDDPQLVEAVRTAATVAMEKHRLDAELSVKLDELRASRERLAEVAYDERRRLERDLHDGAQQRLVSLALELRMARARLGPDSHAASQILESTASELQLALGELRELARGIHPAILSDRGLGPALASLASRTPFAVTVQRAPEDRLPAGVELAAYFFVSEALTNAIKHASATHATVCVTHVDDLVTVEVADDGVGGADPAKGSGLRGLFDRLSALGGRLEVDSQPGRGTVLRATIPCR